MTTRTEAAPRGMRGGLPEPFHTTRSLTMSELSRKVFLAETAAVREHLAEQEQQPPADRAAVYDEVADRLAADAEQGDKEGFTRIYRRAAAKQVREWGEELRRLAAEGQPGAGARQDGGQQ